MKKQTKLKFILGMIVASLVSTGINLYKFNVKHMDDKFNSRNGIISDLRDSYKDWEPPINKFVGDTPLSIFIGDANNDGYNDIATANSGSNDISILLWNDTSSDLDPQITRSVGNGPWSVFIGDANNDGYNDIATANSGSNDISILLWNDTSGDWNTQITKPVGISPYSIYIGDANNDGYNDIVTANGGSDDMSILLWNSTLEDWDSHITKSVGDTPTSLFIGDANNDGYNDIVSSNAFSNDISIYFWDNILDDWDSEITKSVGNVPFSVFIGDANNNGYNDVVTANTDSNNVSIFLWDSSLGDWDSQITRYVGGSPLSIFIGDANNDGYNDITTANSKSDDISVLRWNNTSGDWDPQITRSVGDWPSSVFIGDANNDGYNDIATANEESDNVSILLWKCLSGDWDPKITKSVGKHPLSVFIGDANNDGYNDIVTANFDTKYVSLFLWNSESRDWNPQITKSVGKGPYSVFIGDANNDGYNDIVTANSNSNDVSILLWNSTSVDWNPQITRSVGDYPESVFIGDVNNDGYNDIATADYSSHKVSILLWNNTLDEWNPRINKTVGNFPSAIFIGDANNDGYNDITTFAEYNVTIFLWNSTLGEWGPPINKSVGDYSLSVFIGDANNDGYNDITTANYFSRKVSIFLWNSTLEDWDAQINKSVGKYPWSVFIGDANNDGYNDIVTANGGSNDISILLWNSTLDDWNPQITKSAGDSPHSIFIGDSDNDGYNDIITANSNSNDISIFLWKPPYISIICPENKVYGPLIGYFPATYGFDNDEEGEYPHGWTSIENGGTIQVISNFNNHKKVVKLNDTNDIFGNDLRIAIDDLSEGIIEFWMGTNNVSELNEIDIWDSNDYNWGIQLAIQSCKFQYKQIDNNWYDIPNVGIPLNNTLHHWRVEFNCTTHKFHVFIDSTDSGALNFKYSHNKFDRFQFHTSTTGVGFCLYADAVGFSWDPAYEVGDNLQEGMQLSFYNNTHLNWIAYSLDGLDNKTIFEQEIMPIPEDGSHTIQLFGRDAECGKTIESEIRYFSVDTTRPEIIIHSPINGEVFGCIAPKYNISLIEPNLESIWYTIDMGITNFTINQLSGLIDQHAWIDAPLGSITISFYAKDILNNTNYEEVVINKAKLLSIDIVNQSYSSSDFIIEFCVYNESSELIDFASFQMWWNGTDVSESVLNLGNGLYFVSLELVTVDSNEEPILLNMTISATGYEDKYFETYITVEPPVGPEPCEIVKFLNVEIIENSYSLEYFNLTFFVCDETEQGIDSATIQMWWNGIDVSDDVVNLGNGLYFVSLEPITVTPGESPILLSMTITADGYEDKNLETYIAVDPDTLEKGGQQDGEHFPFIILIIAIISVAGGIGVTLITIGMLRRRKPIKESL